MHYYWPIIIDYEQQQQQHETLNDYWKGEFEREGSIRDNKSVIIGWIHTFTLLTKDGPGIL